MSTGIGYETQYHMYQHSVTAIMKSICPGDNAGASTQHGTVTQKWYCATTVPNHEVRCQNHSQDSIQLPNKLLLRQHTDRLCSERGTS